MTLAPWFAALGLPLVVAAALGLLATSRVWQERGVTTVLVLAAPVTCLPAVVLALLPGDGRALDVPWLLVGTHLELDALARPLLLVSALLYGAAIAAVAWTGTARRRGLTAYLLLCHAGTATALTAGDAVTFYLGYAVMSFAAYGLVVHSRSGAAMRAGRVYMVLTVVSEGAVLGAVLFVAAAGGTRLADAPAAVAESDHTALIVLLLLVGFGVKAGTLPLHVWLPLAHPAAPPAASAVLSGAMVKVGIVGWLRLLPLGEVELHGWGVGLVVVALLGAFLAVPAGVLQGDAKVALAYSTISQMGFLTALVGVALAAPELSAAVTSAAVAYAVHHALAKGALFLGVPVWRHHAIGVRRFVVGAGLVGAALAVAGAPFSSGAVGKYAAKTAVEDVTLLGVDLVALLPLIATGSTLLLLRFGRLLLDDTHQVSRRADPELGAWLLLVAAGISLPWVVTDRWIPVAAVPGMDPVTLWEATWPILLGLGLGAVATVLARRGRLPRWAASPDGRALPPGDLIVPEERLARSSLAVARLAVRSERHLAGRARERMERSTGGARLGRALDSAESAIGSRSGNGLLVLLFLLALAGAGVLA